MNELDFIIGLMAENSDALGFIQYPTLEDRYLAKGRFLIQRDGKEIGYILHGAINPGGELTIAQAVIDFDFREAGHGVDLVNRLIQRAQNYNMRAITLHCAEDLPSNAFWEAHGFDRVHVLHPKNRRNRAINVYRRDLWPVLFKIKEYIFIDYN